MLKLLPVILLVMMKGSVHLSLPMILSAPRDMPPRTPDSSTTVTMDLSKADNLAKNSCTMSAQNPLLLLASICTRLWIAEHPKHRCQNQLGWHERCSHTCRHCCSMKASYLAA